MGRNSGGEYTNPIPPFVPGTTIKTQEVNAKFGDVYAALSDSLSRSGQGFMQVPLALTEGSVASPSLTFASDTGTGLYRPAPYTVRMVSQAATLQEWTLTYVHINRPLTINNTTPNATGLTVSGNGTGAGAVVTGGAGSGNAPGARGATVTGGAGAGSGSGGTGLFITGGAAGGAGGSVQGLGLESTGGIAGIAAPLNAAGTVRPDRYYFRMGTIPSAAGATYPLSSLAWTNANGANEVALDSYARTTAAMTGWEQMRFGLRYDVDNVAGAGGMFEMGTTGASISRGAAATATTPAAGLTMTNSHIAFADTVVSPSATTAAKNTLAPSSLPKVWGTLSMPGGGAGTAITIPAQAGFGIQSANLQTLQLSGQVSIVGARIVFATPFLNTSYLPKVEVIGGVTFTQTGGNGGANYARVFTKTTTYMDVVFYFQFTDAGGSSLQYTATAPTGELGFLVFGFQ